MKKTSWWKAKKHALNICDTFNNEGKIKLRCGIDGKVALRAFS